MAMRQISVFVENKQGSLVKITDVLAKENIDLRAMSIADTQDFGILRGIVNQTEEALQILRESGHLVQATEVVAVKIGDAPGKLSQALHALNEAGVNVEYLYAFLARTERHAYVVLRVEDNAAAEAALEAAGYHLITEADVCKL